MSAPDPPSDPPPLQGKRVAFVGRLGGVTRREAQQLVRGQGGRPAEKADSTADLIVVGADQLPLGEQEELLDEASRRRAAEGKLEIISETQLWQKLGLVECDQGVRRLYTPAMLADLLHVPLLTIRRWHRRGLIVPARVVHRLPYFDFQEVATARRLAQLLAAGASPAAIEKKLDELSRYVPDVERPLAQLAVIVEGKQILLRQGEGLIEPGGQRRIDFDTLEERRAADSETTDADADGPAVGLREFRDRQTPPEHPKELLRCAASLEDEGELVLAAEAYRAAMAAGGLRAETCFQLAEVLYRLGDLPGARERYYTAIELDEDFVESRANLGCVLAETGEIDLAIAAFQGALHRHRGYPDVHYHLARTLDDVGRSAEAEDHWREFLALAPDSPWSEEARSRLGAPPE